MNGHHFAGPTQLLPTVGDPDETDLALKAFTQALKVAGGTDKGEQVKVPQGSFDWKEYRAATKAVLAAMANSLQQFLGTFSHLLGLVVIVLRWLRWRREVLRTTPT